MNFAGKFGSGTPDNFSSAGLKIDALGHQGGGGVTIPDAHLLFSGDYSRSGADLIVLSVVNFGAEIIADGNIHVYAPLRGRAIAGARGNVNARVFSTCMEAQLVSIAGIYRTSEVAMPPDIQGKTAQVRLVGESLVLEPL